MANKPYERFPSHPRAPYHWGTPGGLGSGLGKRVVSRVRVPPFIVEPVYGRFPTPGVAGMILLQTSTDLAGRFRLYATAQDRTDDLDREVDVAATTPCILDIAFSESSDVRLFNQDVEGVPAFNRDDPALDVLYYTLTAGASSEPFYSEDLDGNPDNSFPDGDQPQMTDSIDYGADFTYHDNPLYFRHRYYQQEDTVRPYSADNSMAKMTVGSFGVETAVGMTLGVRRGYIDTTQFYAMCCMMVPASSDPDTYNYNYIRGGFYRGSSTTVQPRIEYVHSLGVTLLDTAPDVALDLLDSSGFTFVKQMVDGKLNVFLVYANEIVCQAVVPDALVAAANPHIGIYLAAADPPEATLAWGGLGATHLTAVFSTDTRYIELAYAPIEQPGGRIEGV